MNGECIQIKSLSLRECIQIKSLSLRECIQIIVIIIKGNKDHLTPIISSYTILSELHMITLTNLYPVLYLLGHTAHGNAYSIDILSNFILIYIIRLLIKKT